MELMDMIHDALRLGRIMDEKDPPKRWAKGPVGPEHWTCNPCGHSWADHDDDGCLWHLCICALPGERK